MAETEQDELQTLERKLTKAVGRAVADFKLIDADDRILVGLSGGKDSYALLDLLLRLQSRAPVKFELAAVNLDPGYQGYQPDVVRQHAESRDVMIHMLEAPIESLVAAKLTPGKAACPICSRIRRGSFYTLAQKLGYNKLALGHHLDDVIETTLLNLFYAGTMRGMPPHLTRETTPSVIRPLCYALETQIARYAQLKRFPIIPCASPHCAAEDRRRQVIKGMLTQLEHDHPQIKSQMRKALGNLQLDTLLDPRFATTGEATITDPG